MEIAEGLRVLELGNAAQYVLQAIAHLKQGIGVCVQQYNEKRGPLAQGENWRDIKYQEFDQWLRNESRSPGILKLAEEAVSIYDDKGEYKEPDPLEFAIGRGIKLFAGKIGLKACSAQPNFIHLNQVLDSLMAALEAGRAYIQAELDSGSIFSDSVVRMLKWIISLVDGTMQRVSVFVEKEKTVRVPDLSEVNAVYWIMLEAQFKRAMMEGEPQH